MRPLQSSLSPRLPQVIRPATDRRTGAEKNAAPPTPPRKRSLNEAAHKLGR